MDLVRRLIRAVTRAFFRLFYELEITGLEHVPGQGAVILAANHVNYFDAPLLVGFVPRRVHFVAASEAFRVPVWRWLMGLYGTIPVVRGKGDTGAVKAAMRVLRSGEALGIFPEGTFTRDGHTVSPMLGTAHIALKTGAPIVPVTISGAFHSWPRLGPRKRRLPRPWILRVKFHPPLPAVAAGDDRARVRQQAETLTSELMAVLDRTLEPALRAEERIDELVSAPAPGLRLYEMFPLFLALAAVFLLGKATAWFSDPDTSAEALWVQTRLVAIGIAYFLYLLVDGCLLKQTALTRALRSYSPFVFVFAYYPSLVRAIPLVSTIGPVVATDAPAALAGIPPPARWITVDWLSVSYYTFLPYLLLSMRHYHFRRYRTFQRFVRGLLLCCYLALLSMVFLPFAGGSFPLVAEAQELGLLAPLLGRTPMAGCAVADFPIMIVTLTVFCLAFDYRCLPVRFAVLAFPSASALASAVYLRGYPWRGIGLSVFFVALVMVYMRLAPITGYDGRRV